MEGAQPLVDGGFIQGLVGPEGAPRHLGEHRVAVVRTRGELFQASVAEEALDSLGPHGRGTPESRREHRPVEDECPLLLAQETGGLEALEEVAPPRRRQGRQLIVEACAQHEGGDHSPRVGVGERGEDRAPVGDRDGHYGSPVRSGCREPHPLTARDPGGGSAATARTLPREADDGIVWRVVDDEDGTEHEMAGTFLYLHGTGAASPEVDRARIERHLRDDLGIGDAHVVCPPWGAEVGPPDLDILPALPVSSAGARRSGIDEESAVPDAAADFHAASLATVGSDPAAVAALPPAIEAIGLRILTDVLARHRLSLTNGVVDFLRNVLFFLRESDRVRAYVDGAIDEARGRHRGGPFVVAGHSLGGVIALESLTARPVDVDLLVTAGSQAPLLWLMGVMPDIGADAPARHPFAPWLNVLNPRDPLAFRAAEVFAWAETPPIDETIEEPRDLLAAHTGYLDEPELYRIIGRGLGIVR